MSYDFEIGGWTVTVLLGHSRSRPYNFVWCHNTVSYVRGFHVHGFGIYAVRYGSINSFL